MYTLGGVDQLGREPGAPEAGAAHRLHAQTRAAAPTAAGGRGGGDRAASERGAAARAREAPAVELEGRPAHQKRSRDGRGGGGHAEGKRAQALLPPPAACPLRPREDSVRTEQVNCTFVTRACKSYTIVVCRSSELGGDVGNDGDWLIFESNRYSRRGFLYKYFPLEALVNLHLLFLIVTIFTTTYHT